MQCYLILVELIVNTICMMQLNDQCHLLGCNIKIFKAEYLIISLNTQSNKIAKIN